MSAMRHLLRFVLLVGFVFVLFSFAMIIMLLTTSWSTVVSHFQVVIITVTWGISVLLGAGVLWVIGLVLNHLFDLSIGNLFEYSNRYQEAKQNKLQTERLELDNMLQAWAVESSKNLDLVLSSGQALIRKNLQTGEQSFSINPKPAQVSATDTAAPEQPEQQPLRSIYPLLCKAERVAIGGGSNSGKTTLAKMLIVHGVSLGRLQLVVSPHEQSHILPGIPVAGVGRNYAEIDIVLQALVDVMTLRYVEVAQGRFAHFGHDGIDITIDEWTSIKRQVPNAGEMLGQLLTESRKVNMRLTVLTHSLNVDTLGVDSGLRQSMFLAWLDGGNGDPYIAQRLKFSLTGAKEIEDFRHPGDEYRDIAVPPREKFIVDIPPSEVTKAQCMYYRGETSLAKIYREVKGKKNGYRPNKSQYEEVRQWLGLTSD